jgi:two-component system sensor histidine kinase HydH
VCILAGILAIVAVKNVYRERQYMVRTLLSEANILMRSLEAISRTAMMRMGWGRNQIQGLMEDAANQPDVLYVALVTPQGLIVAHSQRDLVGTVSAHPAPDTGKPEHRFVDREVRTFEVSRPFQIGRRFHRGRHSDHPPPAFPPDEIENDLYILVGLDPKPFEDAVRQDLQQMALLFGVLLLGGAAGFFSLIWAQNYRSVRRSLQNIEAFTSTVVNQMPVGLVAAELNGRIQRSNEAAQIILRQSIKPDMAIGALPCFLPVMQQLKEKETLVEEEVQCRTDDAHYIPLLVNAALLRDGQEQPVGYVFLFSDLTNIKQLEEQLRRSERLAALGRLAAGVAHEIRNPLSSIKGFATILAGKADKDPQAQKIAQVMQQEVDRLNRVITELLDFARPIEIRKQHVDCSELLRHTIRLIEKDASSQGVSIEAHVEPDGLQADLDPDRFAQVLLNLYLNALQAMETGGSLRIKVQPEKEQIVWTVADSGVGIPPENIPHIFDPYFTTKPHGVGLGLAIVHKLIEAHDGDIEAASSPGQGTTFMVRIPRLDA